MLTAHQKLTRCVEISSRESEGARDFQQADLHLEIKLKIKDKGKLKEIYDYSVISSFPRQSAAGRSRAGPGCTASHSSAPLPVLQWPYHTAQLSRYVYDGPEHWFDVLTDLCLLKYSCQLAEWNIFYLKERDMLQYTTFLPRQYN